MMEIPFEGLTQGPIEFGVGISEGASSMLKNSVAGTF